MSVRDYQFIVGAETDTLPTSGDPVDPDDTVSLEYAQNNFVKGGQPVADLTALAALAAATRFDGDAILVLSSNTFYRFDSGSAAAADGVRIVAPAVGTGRWFRVRPGETALTGDLASDRDLTVGRNLSVTGEIVSPKVSGNLLLQNATGSQPTLQLSEDPDNGTNKVIIQAPATLASDYTLTLPVDDGASGQLLTTDGSGATSWSTPAGAQDSSADLKNLTITATVASNALTIALKNKAGNDPSGGDSVNIAFRNSPITSGVYTVVPATAATSIVVPSGATLGHSNGAAAYVYVYALNNAGTVELMVTSTAQDDTVLQTTTAIDTASDSLTGEYSTAARSNVAVRLIGKVLSTQTTAGTWASAPSKIVLREETKEATAMDDSLATSLGLKVYTHTTAYNGGITPTFTMTSGGITSAYSALIPYKMQDGSWRMRFNIFLNLNAPTTNNSFTINGVTWLNNGIAFSSYYPISGMNGANGFTQGYAFNDTNVRITFIGSARTDWGLTGDAPLNSKPTWAY
jgi:hypothetical protein